MQEYLRVKSETGTEFSIPKTQYEFAPEAYTVLDKPAVDTGGDPLPAKHKTSASAEAAKKATSGQKAATNKEKS